jgi:predicted TIM-barrel fold metal-dependent hydrolase/SAM-dependent methyltransferase
VFADTTDVLRLVRTASVKLTNICLSFGSLDEALRQHKICSGLAQGHSEHFGFIGTFPWKGFEQAAYPSQVRTAVDDAYDRGAVGIKVWKDIGMQCKESTGKWAQIDHQAFQPAWDRLVELGLPLVAHLGDSLDAWLPLNPDNPRSSYLSANPQWHWYNRKDAPSHEAIMAARDRMMTQNPRLRVVGCHLASLERDLDALARLLDRFPQMAVDTAARITDLLLQDRDKVRHFIIRYEDRILYGSDSIWGLGLTPPRSSLEAYLEYMLATWQRDLAWLATDDELTWQGRAFRGLALPRSVLEKILYGNACAWYPGIESGKPARHGAGPRYWRFCRETNGSASASRAGKLIGLGRQLTSTTLQPVARAVRSLARKVVPLRLRRRLWAAVTGRQFIPPVGSVRFGDLRRTAPFSGPNLPDRGKGVREYYVEKFLAAHADAIRGRVLQDGPDPFPRRDGGERLLDRIGPWNGQTPVFCETLEQGAATLSGAFDCIILNRTLHTISDPGAALRSACALLKPGGTLLATIPGGGCVTPNPGASESHRWHFSTTTAKRLLGEVFPTSTVLVAASGNVLSAAAALFGLSADDLTAEELDCGDENYELLITVRASKPKLTVGVDVL